MIIKGVLLVFFMTALGWVGTQDSKTMAMQANADTISEMSLICHQSYQVINGKLEQQCSNMIDYVQSQGYEVLNDGQGNFWAEKK